MPSPNGDEIKIHMYHSVQKIVKVLLYFYTYVGGIEYSCKLPIIGDTYHLRGICKMNQSRCIHSRNKLAIVTDMFQSVSDPVTPPAN